MRGLDTNLTTAQKGSSLDPAIRITLSLAGSDDVVLGCDRIKKLNHIEEPWRVNAKEAEFDNSDGYFTEKALQGYKAVISWGLVTKAGKKHSDTAPMWVTWQQLNSVPGQLSCLLTMLGIPDLMDEDEASESYIPTETDTKTVKTLINEIAGATLACYSHCTAYEVVWEDGYDALADTYKPKDSFRIYIGGSRLAALRRLIEYTGNVYRWGSDGKIHVLKPKTSGEDYDYEYSLKSGHSFFSKAYRKTLVLPNYIVVRSQPDDDPQYSGYAQDDESYALLPKRKYIQTRLQSNTEAEDIAKAILGRYQLNCEVGSAEVPINCGAELFDYVKVTDEREKDYRAGNIGSITRTYNAEKRIWNMRFTFGDPPVVQHIKELYQDLKKAAEKEGGSFERLYAKDAYIEHLNIDEIDAIWLDPDSNIDPTKLREGFYDDLPDGETYARVKSMHLDAGQLKLDENIFYKAGYDPNTKRRNFTSTPTTPYDLGDMWHDVNVVKRCTTARATGAYVAGDWTQVSIDEIKDGSIYQRAKSLALTAGGMVILDKVYIDSEAGLYDLVARADISAHHIKLSSVEQSSGYRTVSDGEKGTWNGKPDNMDEIGQGSSFWKLAMTEITSGHIKLSAAVSDANHRLTTDDEKAAWDAKPDNMDEIDMGVTWGKPLKDQITVSGYLKLNANTYKDGEWYNESGVEIDAAHGINIYGVNQAFTTRATKYGAIQCYVGSNGKIYAGGGTVIIGAGGIEIRGSTTLKFTYAGSHAGYIYVSSSGNLVLAPASGYKVAPLADIWAQNIEPQAHETYYCGYSNKAWKQGYFRDLFSDDGAVHDYTPEIELVKAIKTKTGKDGRRVHDSRTLPQEMVMLGEKGQGYVNLADLSGLTLSCLKHLIQKVETLEAKVGGM